MISGSRRVALVTHVEESEGCEAEKCLKKVNQYLLIRKVGTGSYGKVYCALDTNTNQRVAVKRINITEMSRSQSGVAQLEREITIMRILKHPNILRLHEVLLSANSEFAFLVLDLAEFGSLGRYIDQKVKLPLPVILSVTKQIAKALSYIHSLGYVHQDVKPWNILITCEGRALLADFGIGHSFQSAGMVVGTPAFQAPEALDDDSDPGEADPEKEDVWALGVTLYQLLFLNLPFHGENLYEIVCDIRSRPVEIPQGTDGEVVRLLEGMLQVDPARRMRMEDVLASSIIASAEDLASEIPPLGARAPLDGDAYKRCHVVAEMAKVCDSTFSFATLVLEKHSPPPRLPKSLSGGSFRIESSDSDDFGSS